MRTTKVLLCAAALAAGVVSTKAQNVYSLNVVGYVNYTINPSFNLIANPLSATDNHLGQILKLPGTADGSIVLVWDTTIQDFSATSPTYVGATQTWIPDMVLNPGQAVFLLSFNPTPFTNTYVGNVLQGAISAPIAPAFNAISSPVPIGGDVSVVLTGFPANDGDIATTYDTTAQDFVNSSSYNGTTHVWVPALNINIGEGLFYLNTGAAGTWVRNFTVQ
jgi:hypothetical protein